ncbi:hypothetical protein P20652_2486 [Pseudoalteromonas sp. BSi20652]|uniref:hypothetical protein n=1 Tax=Pseudoalteromonas sp. BSi20652 TaxID=388384 RepID=UPI0002319132|nr:hypothetical protein [Pseudoalteromonas sp. BSi20652]GAA60620.1 hypothetical protein P20652_2486 [Pseudoalteromonas sp. BSi20652]
MQSNILYIGLGLSWLLLISSLFLTIFSRFKHTKFKQHLFRFLNLALLIQVLVGALYATSTSNGNTSSSYWALLTIQIACNLLCYISVKRRIARVKSSLDSFSMD